MQISQTEELESKRQFLQALDSLFQHCIQEHVSDLHFEPQGQLKLRKQLNLLSYSSSNPSIIKKIAQRFKILARLDISQYKLPQDGQFTWLGPDGHTQIPCRISCCPTLHGEKIVIRLLKHRHLNLNWHTIGLSPMQKSLIERYLQNTDGLIIVNGVTGSGKTTTLYTLLEQLNQGHKNIISIEDPIEIPYLNFTQIELQPELGFYIDTALRTVLRQDPDVIMIGEIRDSQTAQLCLHAAQTGHLVVTSLHAHHPIAAIQRLFQLGIHHHQLIQHLKLLISQTLKHRPNEFTLTADFEILEMKPHIQEQILKISSPYQLTNLQ